MATLYSIYAFTALWMEPFPRHAFPVTGFELALPQTASGPPYVTASDVDTQSTRPPPPQR
jgi:hypothetical protein